MSLYVYSRTRLAPRADRLLCALGLAALFALYISMAPHTVQGLDAGELVAGAYNRTLVHAPGYPFWVWLMYAGTRISAFGTVFFRASFINLVWAMLTLACLSLSTQLRLWVCITLVVPLALQQTFFTYALIPDVFMLHGLLFAALCLTYDRCAIGPVRSWLLAVLFALGMANHQTFMFTAPLVVQGVFAHNRKRQAWGALACSLGVCVLLYASLMLMQPTDLRAFGHLQSAQDWLGHVLRQPYGTWQLSRTDARVMPWVHWLHFARLGLSAMPITMLLGCVLPALMVSHAAYRRLLPHTFWWLWGTMTIYMVVFFSQANQTDVRVIERFFLMPLVAYTYLAIMMYKRMHLSQRRRLSALMGAAAVLACINHVADDAGARDLSGNTIVEDYAQNLLRMAQMHPPTVLLVEGDAPLGALRYVQYVQQMSADVPVIASTGPAGWQLGQLYERHPSFVIPDLKGRGLRTSDLMARLIEPNEPAFSFLLNTTRGIDVSRQQVVYMGLGRRLQMGMGRGVDQASLDVVVLRSSPAELKPTSEPREDKVLFAAYAMADFVAGKFSREPANKRAHFARALALVPYCWPAAYELCLLDDALDDTRCHHMSDAARANDARYF